MPAKSRRTTMTEEQKVRERALARRTAYLRTQGRGGMIDAGPMQKRIRDLHDRHGVSLQTIADKTGLSVQAVMWHYRGVNGQRKQPLTACRWLTSHQVMTARFDGDDSFLMPAYGMQRRVQALVAGGWPYSKLADMVHMDTQHFHQRVRLRDKVTYEFDQQVRELFDKLQFTDPAELGVSRFAQSYAKGVARKHRFAPDHCWDADTIDDPQAFPEWTGACGTANGFAIHIRDGIPTCDRCRQASRTYEKATSMGGGAFSPDRLRTIREAKGWTRPELGAAAGVSADSVRVWEIGRNRPTPKYAEKVAAALGVDPEDFYEETS